MTWFDYVVTFKPGAEQSASHASLPTPREALCLWCRTHLRPECALHPGIWICNSCGLATVRDERGYHRFATQQDFDREDEGKRERYFNVIASSTKGRA